jgi:hypothetical protein
VALGPSHTPKSASDAGVSLSAEAALPYARTRLWIDRFYGQDKPESLISALKREITPESVFDFLLSENWGIKAVAMRAMQPWLEDPGFNEALSRRLRSSDTELKKVLLYGLAGLPLPCNAVLSGTILDCLDDTEAGVRQEAARVICYRFPQYAGRVLALLGGEAHSWLVRLLCLSGNQEVIPELLKRCGYPDQRAPLSLGFLLSPEWLASRFKESTELMTPLMRQFGYILPEACCTADISALLAAGFHYVIPEMLDQPGLHRRRKELGLALFPFTNQELRAQVSREFDYQDRIERALLIGEVRAGDRANIEVFKARKPFDRKAVANQVVVRCLHAQADFCEEILLQEGFVRAERLGIPHTNIGEFLLDWASMLLVLDPEKGREAEIFLSGKWHALKVLPTEFHEEILNESCFPVSQDHDCPALKHVILGPHLRPRTAVAPALSPGAASSARLAEYFNLKGLNDYLMQSEDAFRDQLPPIGVEVQVVYQEPDYHLSLPWKQVLRYFDINSPRRPVFGAAVEAAFRPAHTFHSPAIALAILFQCGLIPFSQDSAMHISLQGDLGSQVKYLLFLQDFVREPRALSKPDTKPYQQMARLMSKGFACLNSVTEACGPGLPPAFRTELRGFRLCVEKEDRGGRLSAACFDDLAAMQLLGGALVSDRLGMQEVWCGFASAVEQFAQSFGSPLVPELLHSNWFESTGDSQDPELVGLLPLIQKREEVRAILPTGEARRELRRRAMEIRRHWTGKAWKALGGEDQQPGGSLMRVDLTAGVPLYLPATLGKRINRGFMHFDGDDSFRGCWCCSGTTQHF